MTIIPTPSRPSGTMQEVLDRCRRMETRLTRFLETQGFDTQTQRATWRDDGVISVPSASASFREIVALIPDEWPAMDEIVIEHKDQILGYWRKA